MHASAVSWTYTWDVAVIGAGATGRALVAALDRAGLRVGLIEQGSDPRGKEPPHTPQKSSERQHTADHNTAHQNVSLEMTQDIQAPCSVQVPPVRWFCLAHDCLTWLSAHGMHVPLSSTAASHKNNFTQKPQDQGLGQEQPSYDQSHCGTQGQLITHVHLTHTHYPHRPIVLTRQPALDKAPANDKTWLCATVASSCLMQTIVRANHEAQIPIIYGAHVIRWIPWPMGWQLALSNGQQVRAQVVVGADGPQSYVRQHWQVPTPSWSFGQNAWVFTYYPHYPRTSAYECFMPQGTLALLPLWPEFWGAAVWIMPPDKDLHDDPRTAPASMTRARQGLPNIMHTRILQVARAQLGHNITVTPSQVWQTPVCAHTALYTVGPGWVLMGDASQAIHPIAGQGLNTGLRMANIIAQHFIRNHTLALPLTHGWSSLQTQLRAVTWPMQAVTSGLASLFASPAGYTLWPACYSISRHMPWIRKKMMAFASGEYAR